MVGVGDRSPGKARTIETQTLLRVATRAESTRSGLEAIRNEPLADADSVQTEDLRDGLLANSRH